MTEHADTPGVQLTRTGVEVSVMDPAHYRSDPSGIECIEIIRHRSFNIGNAIKYLWRAGLKDSDADIQDLKKAMWYIQDEIQRLEAAKASKPPRIIFGDSRI